MAKTLGFLRGSVLSRLSDEAQTFWTAAEVDRLLIQAYQELVRATRILWDIRYAENLPAGFSYTALWERAFVVAASRGFDYGVANFTIDDERRLLTEAGRLGPANHTSPFEATASWLADARARTTIAATATFPLTVIALDRSTWDDRVIGILRQVEAARLDSQYLTTEGEVEALIVKTEGLHTIRKVRVPSSKADTYAIEGSWGVLRLPTDITDAAVSGSWGVPQRIPTLHPIVP